MDGGGGSVFRREQPLESRLDGIEISLEESGELHACVFEALKRPASGFRSAGVSPALFCFVASDRPGETPLRGFIFGLE
jgi:hypothetical protein